MRRLDRLLSLLLLLRSRRGVTLRALTEELGVSERTVYRDLRSLEAAGVPITHGRGEGYGVVEGYHLPPVMLGREEVTSLCFALGFAEALTDGSAVAPLRTAAAKIASVLPSEERLHLENVWQRTRVGNGSMQLSRRYPGAHLMALQSAVGRSEVLHLRYFTNARNAVGERDVEPLGLLYYGDHWHLIAYCRRRRDTRDFRVDRIQAMRPTGELFSPRRDHSFARFVEAFSRKEPGVPVRIRVPRGIADYVKDKSHFWLVRERERGDHVVLSYRVPSLESIAGWLLSFGTRIEVLEPTSLRSRLAAAGRDLARHHGVVSAKKIGSHLP